MAGVIPRGDVPVRSEVPTMTDVPKSTKAPAMEDVPRSTKVPTMTDMPKRVKVPTMTDMPKRAKVPTMTDMPKRAKVPTMEDMPKRAKAPTMEDMPKRAKVPTMTDMPKRADVSVMGSAPVGDSVPTREEIKTALEERHGKVLQSKFSAATVAICGLGGLGSNIALSLARAGIGRLILIDFDRVDITNLHRQQYKAAQVGRYKTEALTENLLEIAPYITIISHTERVTEDNFEKLLGDADIICEAFDRPEAKAMLVNGVLETMPEKYLVAASGMAGLESANSIRTRRITEHFYLCGDGISDVDDDIGLVSSRVMVCAAHQAHMVLRILAARYRA